MGVLIGGTAWYLTCSFEEQQVLKQHQFEEQQKQQQQALEEKKRKKEKTQELRLAISKISVLLFKRKERASLLRSALHKKFDTLLVRHRKEQYDESYVNWNAHNQEIEFLINNILNKKNNDFSRELNKVLVSNILAPLDKCLTEATTISLSGKPIQAKNRVNNCTSNDSAFNLVIRAGTCGKAFMKGLHNLSENNGYRLKYNAQKLITANCTKIKK